MRTDLQRLKTRQRERIPYGGEFERHSDWERSEKGEGEAALSEKKRWIFMASSAVLLIAVAFATLRLLPTARYIQASHDRVLPRRIAGCRRNAILAVLPFSGDTRNEKLTALGEGVVKA